MPVNLAIFDLDMTLIDSREDIALSAARALKRCCSIDLSIDEVIPFVGLGLSDMFKGLAPEVDHDRIRACVREYRRWYYDHCRERSRLYDGVRDGLAHLRSKGYRLAVATAKRNFMAYRVLGKFDLIKEFHLIQGIDGLASKPDPAIVNMVCKKTNTHPNKAIMIGDTSMDILVGKSAGAKTIAVTYGIAGEIEMKALNPNFISPDFNSVISVLLKLRKH